MKISPKDTLEEIIANCGVAVLKLSLKAVWTLAQSQEILGSVESGFISGGGETVVGGERLDTGERSAGVSESLSSVGLVFPFARVDNGLSRAEGAQEVISGLVACRIACHLHRPFANIPCLGGCFVRNNYNDMSRVTVRFVKNLFQSLVPSPFLSEW